MTPELESELALVGRAATILSPEERDQYIERRVAEIMARYNAEQSMSVIVKTDSGLGAPFQWKVEVQVKVTLLENSDELAG